MKLDHLKLIGKFEFSNSCAFWTIKLSLKNFRINWSQIIPHLQKRKCSSPLVLQVLKSAKILEPEKYLFQGSKQSSMNPFPEADLGDGLTFSYAWNAISSQILRVRLWMFPRSKCNICRSLGRNPCLGLSPDAFVAVISISLFDQFSSVSRKLLNG
jgi:hypothetical protein